ncbi:FAD:protein FMN transferase [Meiothermus rufus]|uniref:FAD:protein FMN transferase n=1 Tax=Meiothermus rufus TaxID=604332 RepID=UPI0003F82866|nr:FAD:protein FMN transferase [Meiothermus rufus]
MLKTLRLCSSRPRYRYRAQYEGVLGTALELQLLTHTQAQARQAEAQLLLEIDRLEGIYSVFHPNSELMRWQAGAPDRVSADLLWLLRHAELWQQRTEGAFNPAAEALKALFEQTPQPDPERLEALRQELQAPLWDWPMGQPRKRTALRLGFNALAKGRIADQAATAARQAGAQEVLVNLGGDLRHLGTAPLLVSIAHPFANADNLPPLTAVRLCNQGLATSGLAQRGPHLFDPRTAQPVTEVVQATVVASDAATADVLATAFCVLPWPKTQALADALGAGCLVVRSDGQVLTNGYFERLMETPWRRTV